MLCLWMIECRCPGDQPEQWEEDMNESIGLLEKKLSKQRVVRGCAAAVEPMLECETQYSETWHSGARYSETRYSEAK